MWVSLDRLPSLDVPTLVVHGELDALVPLANGELIAKTIPGAELVVVPGSGHLLNLEDPDTVNARLRRQWLATEVPA